MFKKMFKSPKALFLLIVVGLIVAANVYFLINNINTSSTNAEYVTKLKSVYTDFNYALQKMSYEVGCLNDLKCTQLFSPETTDKTFGDILVKHLPVAKNCGTAPGQGCFASYTNENYDGSSSSVYELDQWAGYRFVTVDGVSFYVWNYAQGCTQNDSTGKTGNLTQACGEIYVDLDGPKKGPNVMGRDTFNLWISNGKGALLYPMGGSDTKWEGHSWWWRNPKDESKLQYCYPGNKLGWPCAGRIVDEGWKMNY